MNYEYENIFDLEDIVLEQQYDVLNTLINLINKNELFIESGYINNEAYDDFVNEMFSIYTEATARNKRQKEIADYVVKNNLHRKVNEDNEPIKTKYGQKKASDKLKTSGWGDFNGEASDTGSSSKKSGKVYQSISKKDQRRMVNTLLQHDFDPKTETIRSDVKNPDGSYQRIKVNLKSDSSKYRHTRDGNVKIIDIDKKSMQSSQPIQHLSIHHELGHHDSHMKAGGTDNFKYKKYDPDDPAIKHIQATRDSGVYVNSHDDGSYNNTYEDINGEELYADLHGFQNSRIRTSKWGNKSSGKNYKNNLNTGTRFTHADELEKYFMDISRITKKIIMYENEDIRKNNMKLEAVKKCIKEKKINKFVYDYLKRKSDISDMEYVQDRIKIYQDMIKEIKDVIQRSKIKIKDMQDHNDPDDIIEIFSDLLKSDEESLKEYTESLNQELKKLDELNARCAGILSIDYNKLQDTQLKEVYVRLNHDISDILGKLQKEQNAIDKVYGISKELMDTSTKMRYDFVTKYGNPSDHKKHNPGTSKGERLAKKREHMKQKQEMLNKKRGLIKEYFTDFFNEYYSLDWLIE